jgi:hypothetical protein
MNKYENYSFTNFKEDCQLILFGTVKYLLDNSLCRFHLRLTLCLSRFRIVLVFLSILNIPIKTIYQNRQRMCRTF